MATRSPRGQRTQGARATGRARLAVATHGRYAEAGARGRHSRSPPACDARSSLSILAGTARATPRCATPKICNDPVPSERERERGGWRRREQGEQEGQRDVSECKRERRGRETVCEREHEKERMSVREGGSDGERGTERWRRRQIEIMERLSERKRERRGKEKERTEKERERASHLDHPCSVRFL